MAKESKEKKVSPNGDISCAINPYALGDLVAGKKIRWNSEKDPRKKLAEILGIDDPKVIFKSNSPLLIPRKFKTKSSAKKIELVSEKSDSEKLQKFFKKHAASIGNKKNVDSSKLMKISSILFSRNNVKGGQGKKNTDVSMARDWCPDYIKWMKKGDYIVSSMDGPEVDQNALGDCYYLAALASICWSSPRMLNYKKQGDNYQICFWNWRLKAEWVSVSQKVPVDKKTEGWVYGCSTTLTETWPAIWEKAFAKWMTGTSSDCPDMTEIEGGNSGEALRRLTGYDYDSYYCRKGNSDKIWKLFWKNTDSKMKAISPMTVSTSGVDREDTIGTIPHHVYSILGIEVYNNVKRVIVRNPWARAHAKKYCRSGTWNGMKLNDNGVFSMEFDKFIEYFYYVYFLE